MQIFGLNLGKKTEDPKGVNAKAKPRTDIKNQVKKKLALAARYQSMIIALLVIGLLGLTTLRMLQYTDPPVDENRVEENLAKFKQIRIDGKVVEKIEQLQQSSATTGPDIREGRTNPFAE